MLDQLPERQARSVARDNLLDVLPGKRRRRQSAATARQCVGAAGVVPARSAARRGIIGRTAGDAGEPALKTGVLAVQPVMTFDAPWGTGLRLTTSLFAVLLGGVAFLGLRADPVGVPVWHIAMVVLPLTILLGSALFVIRGYELSSDNKLLVQRLGWQSVLDLGELQSAEVDPQAMRWSLRTFGNGGLFCIAGRFYNKRLGAYRAFATDPRCAVVLRFAERVVVVTPANPAEFAARLGALKKR